jgi:hypothetical protein
VLSADISHVDKCHGTSLVVCQMNIAPNIKLIRR